jgi:hypothetical protein
LRRTATNDRPIFSIREGCRTGGDGEDALTPKRAFINRKEPRAAENTANKMLFDRDLRFIFPPA